MSTRSEGELLDLQVKALGIALESMIKGLELLAPAVADIDARLKALEQRFEALDRIALTYVPLQKAN